jgi:hypothetical protein
MTVVIQVCDLQPERLESLDVGTKKHESSLIFETTRPGGTKSW